MNADYSQKDYKTQPIKYNATNLCVVFEWNYMDSKKGDTYKLTNL